MNKQISKTICGASLAILMLTVFAQVRVSAQLQEVSEQGLDGSWDVLVTARDCDTGTPFFSFPAMTTYHQGGTMQETDLGGPGFVRLSGHGTWKHQKRGDYTAAFRFLNFEPDRTPAGTNVVRSTISLSQNGNEYTSTDTLEILDPNGTVIATGCATQTATRFE